MTISQLNLFLKSVFSLDLLFLLPNVFGQANFTIPDTVCVNEVVQFKNLSSNAQTYLWNYCSANLAELPAGDNIGKPDNTMKGPSFLSMGEDGSGFHLFVTEHVKTSAEGPALYRLDFGNDLMGTPTVTNLGDFNKLIPIHAEGIKIIKDQNNWYGFVIGGTGGSDRLVRLDFGTSLTNIPTAYDLGNFGKFSFPVDFVLENDNGTWVGFTVNNLDNHLLKFTFGNSLSATPVISDLGILTGKNSPFGLHLIKNEMNWYLFVTNLDSKSITRLDFGGSLNNNPSAVNLGTHPSLKSPSDLTIVYDCERIYGFLVNRLDYNMVRLDFENDIESQPTFTDLGNIGGLYHPHGISEVIRTGNDIVFFIANIDNQTISRINYSTCNAASVSYSTSKEAADNVFYTQPGRFNINLVLDANTTNQTMFCKDIVVLPVPEVHLGNDTTICSNVTLPLDAGNAPPISYLWNDSSTNKILNVANAGTYWAEVKNDYGCKHRDTITISHFEDDLDLGPDTIIFPGEVRLLDATSSYQNYSWSNGESASSIQVNMPGSYFVEVQDANLCLLRDTITLRLDAFIPNMVTPNGDGYNDTWHVDFLSNFPQGKAMVFDRFGKLLYQFSGKEPGWDGYFNGKQMPADSYWYIIETGSDLGNFKGYFTLVR